MLKDLVLKNRSYRGYDPSRKISREELEAFVDCARLTPSGGNLQPLRYYLAWEQPQLDLIQPLTKWGAALPERHLPVAPLVPAPLQRGRGALPGHAQPVHRPAGHGHGASLGL